MFAAGIVLVFGPWVFLSSDLGFNYDIGITKYLGIVPIIIGGILMIWSMQKFAVFGRGTPAPIAPPSRLVTYGPHAVVRNPIYVGAILVLIGESIVFQSYVMIGYALSVWLFMHLFVVLYEEPTLKSKFGEEYEDYRLKVPRWIPRFKLWK